jgi:hypothetical protein
MNSGMQITKGKYTIKYEIRSTGVLMNERQSSSTYSRLGFNAMQNATINNVSPATSVIRFTVGPT